MYFANNLLFVNCSDQEAREVDQEIIASVDSRIRGKDEWIGRDVVQNFGGHGDFMVQSPVTLKSMLSLSALYCFWYLPRCYCR